MAAAVSPRPSGPIARATIGALANVNSDAPSRPAASRDGESVARSLKNFLM